MPHYPIEIEYSDKYDDAHFEFRHVHLPKDIYRKMPRARLLTEAEWRALGSSKAEDGNTMQSIVLSLISYCSEGL
jgi:cyclin-dependent kinase regulatory subunit CKS1